MTWCLSALVVALKKTVSPMASELKSYELVVIGGGPAGIVGAATATDFQKRAALVDDHIDLGGAGINTGTVPSKTLRETALALSGMKTRDLYGVDLSLRREATVADFLRHEINVRAGFNAMIVDRLRRHKADVYYGAASFVDPHTLRLRATESTTAGRSQPASEGEKLVFGESILIATGSTPTRPALFPFGSGEVYDSDTILQLDRLPKSMAVVGAGVIGSEYGCTFAALDTEVHIIDGRDSLLPFLDGEISRALMAGMERRGITFHWKERVAECASSPAGITLRLSSGKSLAVDAVLVAAGRRSKSDALNLEAAGVRTDDRGIIPVDDHFRTNVPHIYAAGDVIGFPALASTSMDQARRAVRFALGLEVSAISPMLPNGIYTIPEVSMVGETEESLQKHGVDYVVGRAGYDSNARGRIIGDVEGFLKLLFRRQDMKLLGVHIIGEQATEVVHIGLMAMLAECTAEVFVEACFNAPTLGGLYKSATFNALRED
jgi:NAD(P) transhydrogenase